jgi:putative ABC transport system permease protein
VVLLGVRNLFQSKARLLMSTGGIALALLLVLALDAIFAGVQDELTTYMNRAGADIWVSQPGVRNLHMSSSTLPASVVDQVSTVPGVEAVTPILYATAFVDTGHSQHVVYLIGLPAKAVMGKPWRLAAGRAEPGAGEVVIDQSVANASGIGLGDSVKIGGSPLRVSGLAVGTMNIVNSIAFISAQEFERLRPSPATVSFVLVRVAAGRSATSVAGEIERQVGGVTAQTSQALAGQERKVVGDMATDLISIMNLTGLLIGLAVMALTVYTATLSRRAEYGVLKAIGASARRLYATVLVQAGISIALALAVSVALTLALSVVVPLVKPGLALDLTALSLAKVALMALGIGAVAAVLPIRQIAGLDPASVFRRRM